MAQNQVAVSPNGVPVPKGRAKAFAGTVGNFAGRAIKDMAIHAGVQREYDRNNSRYRDDDNNFVGRKQFGGTPESLAGIQPNFDWRTFQQRVIPRAGTSQRGKQTGRKEAYASGTTTEDADITMGGTLAWNAQGQGSFAFPELAEPSEQKPVTEVGNVKPAWQQPQPKGVQGDLFAPTPLWAQEQPQYVQPSFDDLQQPARKGGIGPVGMARIRGK
jgi:hypothetical protein